VLLIEADLRRGTEVGALHSWPEPSLADVLIGDATVQEAIRTIDLKPQGSIDVLIAGPTAPPNVGELIESHAMEVVLEQARSLYDLVVVDTPPISVVADAIPLLKRVDGVIVVGRIGVTRRDAAEQLRDRLASLQSPALGVVVNRVRDSKTTGYRSRHRYGYAYAPAKAPARKTPRAGSSTNSQVNGPVADGTRANGSIKGDWSPVPANGNGNGHAGERLGHGIPARTGDDGD
jgi:capsular exopolysaccharide synthesis family protein